MNDWKEAEEMIEDWLDEFEKKEEHSELDEWNISALQTALKALEILGGVEGEVPKEYIADTFRDKTYENGYNQARSEFLPILAQKEAEIARLKEELKK